METLEQRAERKTNLFSYRNGYSTAKDAYIEGYKDCQSTFDNLPKVKAWITRDKDGDIWLFWEYKPIKNDLRWTNGTYCNNKITEDQLPEGCNPKWSDDDPIEVNVRIRIERVRYVRKTTDYHY